MDGGTMVRGGMNLRENGYGNNAEEKENYIHGRSIRPQLGPEETRSSPFRTGSLLCNTVENAY